MATGKNCFKFCVAQEIITPPKSMFPLELKGFAARQGLCSEVYDDIYAKVVLLSGAKDLLLVVLDLTMVNTEACQQIKSKIMAKYPLSEEQIWVTATHTHSSIGLTSSVEGYQDYAYDKIMKAVDKCYASLESGSIYFAKGISNVGISRRLKTPDGKIKFAPSWDNEIDKEMFILKLEDSDNYIKCIIYNLPCHGTALGPLSLKMCNDFMGFANKYVSERFNGAVSIYLPANGADVKPKGSARRDPGGDFMKDSFITCTIEETDSIGKSVADEITDIINNGKFLKVDPDFRTSYQDVYLFGPKPDIKDAEEKFNVFKIRHDEELSKNGEVSHMTNYSYNRFKRHLDRLTSGEYNATIQVPFAEWYLGNDVKLIAIACEPSSQLGLMIKNIFKDDKTMIIGYTNGIIGYICNSVQHLEGGYEAESLINRGLAGPLPPETDSVICNAVKALHFDLK